MGDPLYRLDNIAEPSETTPTLHRPLLQSTFAQSHQDPGDPHHAERLPSTASEAAALPRRLGGVISDAETRGLRYQGWHHRCFGSSFMSASLGVIRCCGFRDRLMGRVEFKRASGVCKWEWRGVTHV